jgi:Ca2+-binding RTX toxin-like protein
VEGGQLLLMKTGAIAGLGYDAPNITAATTSPNALVILGSSQSDHIGVEQNGNNYDVEVGDKQFAFTAALDRIFAVGYDGNDHIEVEAAIAASLFGGAGNDQLTGGAGSDVLAGGLGNDDFVADPSDLLLDFGTGNDHKKKN